jgi:inner membrane protein
LASAFSHAFVAVAAGHAYAMEPKPWRFWAASIACSILPDADVVGFALGIQYGDFLGHRGFSHSVVFALLLGAALPRLVEGTPWFSRRWVSSWLYFAAVTASHGVLDAMTDGGLGVAFFSPFDSTRYFFPWRPVRVSPIEIDLFFTTWGLKVLATEVVYIWVPAALLALVIRRTRQRDRTGAAGVTSQPDG